MSKIIFNEHQQRVLEANPYKQLAKATQEHAVCGT